MLQEFIPEPEVFRAAVDNSFDVVELLREDGTILYVSSSVQRVLGFEPAQLVGTNAFDLVHPEDRARLEEELAGALIDHRGQVSPYRCRTAHGNWRWIKSTGAFLDPKNELTGAVRREKSQSRTLVINSRDITEHEESRQALVKANNEMQTIWESISDAFFAVDEQWNFTYLNGSGERLLQRDRGQLLGRNLWEEFPEALQFRFFEQYHRAMREQTPVAFEEFYPPLSTWFEVRAYPSSAGLAVYFRDITERRQIEEQRCRAAEEQRAARRFLQSVLDALSAHVAVLDEKGEIIAVNAAWETFALTNEANGEYCGVGCNYLEVCDKAKGRWSLDASVVAGAIRDILAGRREEFCLEYPCHSAQEKRWFVVRITRMGESVPGSVVVAHENVTEAKEAREAVRYSQRLYQALTDNFPNGTVYIFDLDQKILMAGGHGLEQMGLSATDVIGKTTVEAFGAGADYAELERALEQSLAGEVTNIEVELRGYWRLMRTVPLFDENSAITGVMAMTQDITERKHTEDALRESEARLRTAQNLAHLGYLEMEVATSTSCWSDETFRILGLEPPPVNSLSHEAEIETLFERIHPDDQEMAREAARALFEEGRSFDIEHRIQRPNGEIRWVQARAELMTDDSGKPVRFASTLLDITERKKAEEAQARLAAIVEFSQDAISSMNCEGIIQTWNRGAEQLYGYTVEEIVGHHIDRLASRDDVPLILEKVKNGESIRNFETSRRRKDGSAFEISLNLSPLADPSGRIIGSCVIARDITERKRTEEALLQSERLYQTLAHNFPNGSVYLMDRQGRILLGAGRGLEAAGLSPETVIGKTPTEIFGPGEILEKLLPAHQAALRGEETAFEVYFQNRWRVVRFVPVHDENGEITRVLSMTQDITEHKQAQENKVRLAAIVESSDDAIISKTLEGIITTWNQGAERVYGYTAEEAIGSDMRMLLPPELPEEEDQVLARLARGERVHNLETRRVRRDGRIIDVSISSSPMLNAAGEVVAASAIVRDVTSQKQAEAERERFFSLSLDLLCVFDKNAIFLRINPAFEKIVGYQPEELLGQSFLEYLHPEDRLPAQEVLQRLAVGVTVMDFVSRFRCRDGSYKSILWATSPYGDQFYGAGRDITAIKATENELQLSVALLQATLESTADGILVVSSAGQITHYNRQFVTMWRLPEEILEAGDNEAAIQFVMAQLINPEEFFSSTHAILNDRAGKGFDLLHFKDGRVFERYTQIQRVQNQEAGRVWSFRDITERVRSEAEKSRLAALLESTTDFVGWNDTHGLAQYINPAGRAMLGLTADEPVEGRPIREFVPAWAGDIILNIGLPTASRNGSWSGETALLSRDGREIPISQVLTAHKDSNGVDLYFSTIARDISESKALRAFLEHSKEELEERVSLRTAELANTNRDLEAEILERQMAVGALREVVVLLEQAREEADGARQKAELARLDAEEAQQEAEQANSAKSEFLSRMSHELRTPMNAILGFGQILEMRPLGPKESESVQHILKAGQHLLQLINEVLEISRIEAGRLSISIEPVPFAETLQEVLDLVRPLANRRGITLVVQDADTSSLLRDAHVKADRQRLRQVLLNLISNAVKYNRENGQVTISLWEVKEDGSDRRKALVADGGGEDGAPRRLLHIEVADTGPGIKSDDQAKLFLPFERLGAEATAVEGTGIGLALAKRLTELMQGRIGVESHPGEGSRFWVELPHATDPRQHLPLESEEIVDEWQSILHGLPESVTLLYIEDNASNLALMESVLSELPQIHLLSAVQGRLGLELARQYRPNLILLDLHLPDIMGDEVLRELQKDPTTRDIPVVMLSADATENQIQRLLADGARRYLTKPLNIKQLLEVISAVVA